MDKRCTNLHLCCNCCCSTTWKTSSPPSSLGGKRTDYETATSLMPSAVTSRRNRIWRTAWPLTTALRNGGRWNESKAAFVILDVQLELHYFLKCTEFQNSDLLIWRIVNAPWLLVTFFFSFSSPAVLLQTPPSLQAPHPRSPPMKLSRKPCTSWPAPPTARQLLFLQSACSTSWKLWRSEEIFVTSTS